MILPGGSPKNPVNPVFTFAGKTTSFYVAPLSANAIKTRKTTIRKLTFLGIWTLAVAIGSLAGILKILARIDILEDDIETFVEYNGNERSAREKMAIENRRNTPRRRFARAIRRMMGGKGTSVRSLFVNDPKGEVYLGTWKIRKP